MEIETGEIGLENLPAPAMERIIGYLDLNSLGLLGLASKSMCRKLWMITWRIGNFLAVYINDKLILFMFLIHFVGQEFIVLKLWYLENYHLFRYLTNFVNNVVEIWKFYLTPSWSSLFLVRNVLRPLCWLFMDLRRTLKRFVLKVIPGILDAM